MKHIVILGAGITGLTIAWRLHQIAHERITITLVEKNSRSGGFIQSVWKEGFLFERGPRGFRGGKKGCRLFSLIEELELKDKLIYASPVGKKRYLLINGKLQPVSPAFLWKESLFSSLLKEPFQKKSTAVDETVASFFERRVGKKFTETLIDPLIRGIFGGDMRTLSMAASFPKLFSFEKTHGSLIKGFLKSPKEKMGLTSFSTGIETLPERMKEKLQNEIDLRFNCFPKKIVPEKGKIRLEFEEGNIVADGCAATIPSFELSALLPHPDPFLDEIPYATITTLNLGFFGKKLPVTGFGFLAPSFESPDFLGMTFDSEIFPDQNGGEKTRCCLIFKGEKSEKEALDFASKLLSSLFHIDEKPAAVDHFIAKKSIPQYSLGHVTRRNNFFIPSLFTAGSFMEGISMVDCIENGEKVAREIAEKYIK